MNLPKEFKVPDNVKTEDFLFRKLTTRDVYLDYIAVMSSIDVIRRTRGGSWPTTDYTFEDDLINLGWHQREFENRSSFTYTVFTTDNETCLGCFYFYNPGFREEIDTAYDVDISFWVTQEAYNKGLYKKLYTELKNFIVGWPFKNPYFSNDIIPE